MKKPQITQSNYQVSTLECCPSFNFIQEERNEDCPIRVIYDHYHIVLQQNGEEVMINSILFDRLVEAIRENRHQAIKTLEAIQRGWEQKNQGFQHDVKQQKNIKLSKKSEE